MCNLVTWILLYQTCLLPPLVHPRPAREGQRLSRDLRCVVGRQEGDRFPDVARRLLPAHRHPILDALVEDLGNVRTIMYSKLVEQPRLIVSLKVDETSEMGVVLDIHGELREAGTLRINYSSKREIPS